MAYVTPNSSIQLFTGLKLTEGAEDTLYFGSRSAQESYFGGLTPTWSASDFTFIGDKDSQRIRVAAPFSTVMNCNYMRYKNTSYENKWMYCFIENVIHINDGCTEIEFTVDPLQTWLPGVDYTLKQCRIVRQHQTDSDNIGDNIQPENIQITTHHPLKVQNQYEQDLLPYHNGLYVATMFPFKPSGNDLFYAYNGSTWDTPGFSDTAYFPALQMIDDVPCGNPIFLFDPSVQQDRVNLSAVVSIFGKQMINIWVLPKDIVRSEYISTGWSLSTGADPSTAAWNVSAKCLIYMNGLNEAGNPNIVGPLSAIHVPVTFFHSTSTMEHNGSSYTVKNKKLFTNPFSYYELETANGEKQIYSFEDMNAGKMGEGTEYVPDFQTVCSLLSENFGVVPLFYNYHNHGFDKQITMPQVPIGALASGDGDEIRRSLLATVMQMGSAAAGTLVGGPAGTVVGAAVGAAGMTFANSTGIAGGTNVNNLNNIGLWASVRRTIRGAQYYPENCKEIDDYFQAYGYTQNKFAVPSIHHRANWTFVQTDGANFTPVSIPAKYMKQINERFDKGVRFHKSASTIGNMDGYTNAISS